MRTKCALFADFESFTHDYLTRTPTSPPPPVFSSISMSVFLGSMSAFFGSMSVFPSCGHRGTHVCFQVGFFSYRQRHKSCKTV